MATQGLLSITGPGNVVLRKIVTGSNGYNIPALAKDLRQNPTLDPDHLLARCQAHDLGGDSLVIQLSPGMFVSEDLDQELPRWYSEKFHDPYFNPRWARGTCGHTEQVHLPDLRPFQMEIMEDRLRDQDLLLKLDRVHGMWRELVIQMGQFLESPTQSQTRYRVRDLLSKYKQTLNAEGLDLAPWYEAQNKYPDYV